MVPSLYGIAGANIHDSTVDYAGNIYVFVRGQWSCMEGVETSHVGRLDHKNGAWVWRTVKHKDECIFGSQQHVVIDQRGRIWFPDTTSVAVVAPINFEKESVLEEDITTYTEENSRYLLGHQITVGLDGRFWSLDMSGHGLVWIDPDGDELEKPLLAWVDELANSSRVS